MHHHEDMSDDHLSVRATNLALAPMWVCHNTVSPRVEMRSTFAHRITFHV